jgi:hypothetical protein
MSSIVSPPPQREQLCTRSCSNKHTGGPSRPAVRGGPRTTPGGWGAQWGPGDVHGRAAGAQDAPIRGRAPLSGGVSRTEGGPAPSRLAVRGGPQTTPGGVGPSGAPHDLYGGAAAAQGRADSRARPAFWGVCTDRRGPRPFPAGGAQGSPDPPPGGLGPRGRAAICTGARRLRKDAQIRPGPGQRDPTFRWGGDRVLFIGTQFSNRYTAVDTPARGRVVVCLVFVCKYVLGPSRVSQPLNLRLCLLRHLGFLTSPHASPTCCRRRLNSYRLLRRSTPGPPSIPWAHLFHLPASPRPPLYTPTMTT